jgi:cellulose synthase/poly-beta-1,6-N-acetylglucosamine synthase-like glycosyltransferase
MECEVTACIPVRNGFRTLGYALYSLEFGAQSEPIKVIVCDNGSWDGTQLMVRGLMQPSPVQTYYAKRHPTGIVGMEVSYNDSMQARFPREGWNIRECFKTMWQAVDTDFILMVDADVDVPRGAVRSMLDMMKADEALGLVGCQYDPSTSHVKHGCAMIRTVVARELLPSLLPDRCMCSQINELLALRKLKCVAVDALKARHCSREK